MLIAIDGLNASGKGTLARMLARRLGLPHLDTGRLYRALALAALRTGIDPGDGPACARLARDLRPETFDKAELRREETAAAAAIVSAQPEARQALVGWQRDFAGRPDGAILDGRDIGTVICPDAPVKFWIHADLECRARRRHRELGRFGPAPTLEETMAGLEARDRADAARAISPAVRHPHAIGIDTTHLDPPAMLDAALAAIARVGNEADGDKFSGATHGDFS